MMLVGVTSHFCAAHRLPGDVLGQGDIHGHSYEVTAWFETDGNQDARVFKAALDGLLRVWDHKMLPSNLQWCEHLARAVGTLARCREAVVRRPLEGLHGRWICDSGSRSQSHDPQGHGPEAGRAAAESGIAQTKAVP